MSDVIGGLALGWGWFALCSIAFGGRLLRFAAPIEAAERTSDLGTGSVVAPLAEGAGSTVRVEHPPVQQMQDRPG
jgi:hypothetical protein